jgi:hypothetical protein
MPVALRTDFEAFQLCAMARRTKGAAQARSLLVLTAVYEAASRAKAARRGCEATDRARPGGQVQCARARA